MASKLKSIEKAHVKWEDRMPVMEIRGKNFTPELKQYHVGDEVELVLKVRVTKMVEGGSEFDYMGDDDEEEISPNKGSATFKVKKIVSHKLTTNKKKSAEESAADKFNRLRREGKSVSQARTLAGM